MKRKTLESFVKACQADPCLHVTEVQGATLVDYQEDVARSIAQYERVAIKSCHNAGKTWLMARIVLWFTSVFVRSKVITTAPTGNLVRKLLWSEIKAGHRDAKMPLGGSMLQTEWKIDDDWFALGFVPRTEAESSSEEGQGKATRFQGFHAPHVLIVFDEAIGVSRQMWVQAEGMMTSPKVKMVVIGNPTSKATDFYKCFQSPAWKKITLSCFLSPNLKANGITDSHALSREIDRLRSLSDEERLKALGSYRVVHESLLSTSWVVSRALEWGMSHPLFLSKVLGEFPETDDHVLISLGDVERAQFRFEDYNDAIPDDALTVIGVDVARMGSDATVITTLRGSIVLPPKKLFKNDAIQVGSEILALINSLPKVDVIVVDATGVGSGVVDYLRLLQVQRVIKDTVDIREIHFGSGFTGDSEEAQKDKKLYANLKAKIFVQLSHDMKKDLMLPPDSAYQEQLPNIIFRFDTKGRYYIESKDEYKKRTGGGSPDEADSLCLANSGRYDKDSVGNFTEDLLPSGGTMVDSIGSGGTRW